MTDPYPTPPPPRVGPSAGWYSDPWNPQYLRWWDGNTWTTHLNYRPNQSVYVPTSRPTTKLGPRGIIAIVLASIFTMVSLGFASLYGAVNYLNDPREVEYNPEEIITTWDPTVERVPEEPSRRDKEILYHEEGSWDACEPIPVHVALPDSIEESEVGEPINEAFTELGELTGHSFELVSVDDREEWDHIQIGEWGLNIPEHDGIVILIEPEGVEFLNPGDPHTQDKTILGLAVIPEVDPRTGFFETGTIHLPEGLTRTRYFELVLLHELAHSLGLSHSEDPDDLMYPEILAQEGFSEKEESLLYHQLGAGAVDCD